MPEPVPIVEDAICPSAYVDGDGRPFSSDGRYVMHFVKEQIPPVRAFWSLTMYDGRQLFAANPINRYAIGDRDALTFNAEAHSSSTFSGTRRVLTRMRTGCRHPRAVPSR